MSAPTTISPWVASTSSSSPIGARSWNSCGKPAAVGMFFSRTRRAAWEPCPPTIARGWPPLARATRPAARRQETFRHRRAATGYGGRMPALPEQVAKHLASDVHDIVGTRLAQRFHPSPHAAFRTSDERPVPRPLRCRRAELCNSPSNSREVSKLSSTISWVRKMSANSELNCSRPVGPRPPTRGGYRPRPCGSVAVRRALRRARSAGAGDAPHRPRSRPAPSPDPAISPCRRVSLLR